MHVLWFDEFWLFWLFITHIPYLKHTLGELYRVWRRSQDAHKISFGDLHASPKPSAQCRILLGPVSALNRPRGDSVSIPVDQLALETNIEDIHPDDTICRCESIGARGGWDIGEGSSW